MMDLIHRVISRVPKSNSYSRDELVGIAWEGYMEAKKSWRKRKAKGGTFNTYAFSLMSFRILDQKRALGIIPRHQHAFLTEFQDAENMLGHKQGRSPCPGEVMLSLPRHKGKTRGPRASVSTDLLLIDAIKSVLFSPGNVQSYKNDHFMTPDGIFDLIPAVSKPRWEGPTFNQLLRGLNRREKRILKMRFVDNHSMLDIGRIMRLTESRISQIIGGSLEKLRERLESKRLELVS